jgi:hypothetical protein
MEYNLSPTTFFVFNIFYTLNASKKVVGDKLTVGIILGNIFLLPKGNFILRP